MKKNGLPLATKEKMVYYKQFEFVRSTFPGYKNISSEVRGPERSEHVTEAATKSCEVGAARQLGSEQKLYSLFQ